MYAILMNLLFNNLSQDFMPDALPDATTPFYPDLRTGTAFGGWGLGIGWESNPGLPHGR